jgi:hypothetical protein
MVTDRRRPSARAASPNVADVLDEAPCSGALDSLIPTPGLREFDAVDVTLPIAEAWVIVRHTDLARVQRGTDREVAR